MNMRIIKTAIIPVIAAAFILCFTSAVSDVRQTQRHQGKEQLEQVLKRTAVSCYAAEGIYPPDLEYMLKHYGIRINEEEYTVIYQMIASNLMPDITVLEK